jgi:predicted phosphodiesterase
VLVIGDAHVDEHQSLERFTALGNKIALEMPDVVVIIGDFLSFNCLSEWDRNKRAKLEGLRYHKEIAAGNAALDRLGFHGYQECRVVYIKGNHEDRLDRYLAIDPTFMGHVSLERDLRLKERNIEVVEWKQALTLNGVSFTHIPINSMGKAIGNPGVAKKALTLYHNSVVFGHTHTLDTAGEHRSNAPHLNQALCVGCFFEHVDEYARGSKTDYWRGVVTLTIYSHNRFDFETTAMSQLYAKYHPSAVNPKPATRIRRATPRNQRPR